MFFNNTNTYTNQIFIDKKSINLFLINTLINVKFIFLYKYFKTLEHKFKLNNLVKKILVKIFNYKFLTNLTLKNLKQLFLLFFFIQLKKNNINFFYSLQNNFLKNVNINLKQ